MEDSDSLQDILPKQPAKAIAPPPKAFRPWHKPRKQYIRKFQWSSEIRKLISRVHFSADSRVFRYLSLPGNDLLDIRAIREVCTANDLVLKYVGFNYVEPGSPDEIQLNLARNDISGLQGIHEQSLVLIERLEAVAETKSLAFNHVLTAGPYHCINIDLCNSVVSRSQKGDKPTYIDAISELIRLQIKAPSPGWLLFLTTRVGPDHIHSRNLRALVDAIQANFLNAPFRNGMEQMVHAAGQELSAKLRSTQLLTRKELKDIFCVGFGKWLLAFLQTAQPKMEFVKVPSYYYSVLPGKPDMVSLGYSCLPRVTLPIDRFKLIKNPPQYSHLSELQMAMTFLDGTRSMKNVDELLEKDRALKDAMIEETEALLRQADYPVDDPKSGYRAWLQLTGAG